MSEATTVKAPRPKPYQIDRLIHRVQTLDMDGDSKFLFRHDFARLDSSNVGILLDREKATKRITEKLGKGRTRARLRNDDADQAFYRALITGGGWRPFDLPEVQDEGLIPTEHRLLYKEASADGIWRPGWMELDKETMIRFTSERMSEAIDRWLMAKGSTIATGGIDFMFEQGGIMKLALAIGDFDTPAYKLLFDFRRPENKRRTRFKDDFAFAIDHSKGEMGKIETVIDLKQGISFFDEYFGSCPDDEAYSQIVFEDKRDFSEQGREPEPVSAVPVEGEPEKKFSVRPYSEELRTDVIKYLNPHFKVELAAAAIQSFSKTDQES